MAGAGGGRGGSGFGGGGDLSNVCDTAWQAVLVAVGAFVLLILVICCPWISRIGAKMRKTSRLRDHPNLSAAEYDKLQERLTDTYEQRIRARGPAARPA